jgi:protein-tyrosine-phosphatase
LELCVYLYQEKQIKMTNERFYPAKERKNDFIVTVDYVQGGVSVHTRKKSVLKGAKVLGMKAWDIENPNYKTEEEYNKQICKVSSDRCKIITVSEFVYDQPTALA